MTTFFDKLLFEDIKALNIELRENWLEERQLPTTYDAGTTRHLLILNCFF